MIYYNHLKALNHHGVNNECKRASKNFKRFYRGTNMVHREHSEGSKAKPRGRPFAKGNHKGKLRNEILATSGRESSIEGGIIAPPLPTAPVEPENILNQLPRLVMETLDSQLKECLEEKQAEAVAPVEVKKEPLKELELVESLDFMNGTNKLSIRFSKRHNRMYRIQVFLNDEHEIRQVTYNGVATGTTFWNLIKGLLKK